jgi:hypothetical protein
MIIDFASHDKPDFSANSLSFQINSTQGAPVHGAGQTGGAPW